MASPTRPYVDAFANAMEAKLAENRHKGDREGWQQDSPALLLAKLMHEVAELAAVLAEPEPSCSCRDIDCQHLGTKLRAAGRAESIVSEAADVANFAMMIADVAGHMRVARPVPPVTRTTEGE